MDDGVADDSGSMRDPTRGRSGVDLGWVWGPVGVDLGRSAADLGLIWARVGVGVGCELGVDPESTRGRSGADLGSIGWLWGRFGVDSGLICLRSGFESGVHGVGMSPVSGRFRAVHSGGGGGGGGGGLGVRIVRSPIGLLLESCKALRPTGADPPLSRAQALSEGDADGRAPLAQAVCCQQPKLVGPLVSLRVGGQGGETSAPMGSDRLEAIGRASSGSLRARRPEQGTSAPRSEAGWHAMASWVGSTFSRHFRTFARFGGISGNPFMSGATEASECPTEINLVAAYRQDRFSSNSITRDPQRFPA